MILTIFGVIFLAEMGDKIQLAAMTMAAQTCRPWAVLTGWFVESLATQTLVLFVIRTVGNPLRSRPSKPLTITTLLIVATGIALPFSPLADALGFVALPTRYFLFLAAPRVLIYCS